MPTEPTLTMAVPPPGRVTPVEERGAPPPAKDHVELGYESRLTPAVRRPHLLAVFTAFTVGLALMVLALFAFTHVLGTILDPGAARPNRADVWESVVAVTVGFGVVSALFGLLFMLVGLKWLAATRS
jgi:hypothetical protein